MDGSSDPDLRGFFTVMFVLMGFPLIQLFTLKRMSLKRRTAFQIGSILILLLGVLLLQLIFSQNLGRDLAPALGLFVCLIILFAVSFPVIYHFNLKRRRQFEEKIPEWEKSAPGSTALYKHLYDIQDSSSSGVSEKTDQTK
ncbi:hypothetical protein ANRL1_02377 [Anaerolineae bacterium]|nr:hypothetical protein ANRL1_02377 [Anaerolineae bacterium]